MPLPRIPLSESDLHAVNVLHASSRRDLQRAVLRMPTYQRTALRELVRVLEDTPRAVPTKPEGEDNDAS